MADPERALQEALAAHKAGHFAEAHAGYERVLVQRPSDARAHYFLGLLHFHRDEMEPALKHTGRSLELAPNNPQAWNVLGGMYIKAGRAEDARRAYLKATEIAPQLAEGWYNLGICRRDAGDVDEAIEALRTAIARQPGDFRSYGALAALLYQANRTEEAANAYRLWAEREPVNAYARHMAAATSGVNAPLRASNEYVEGHFDRFADEFDRQLARLDYRVPELIAEALLRRTTEDARLDVLDAGCGTGLCGPLIRDRVRRLVGVDLSARMLERAHERGGYDELVVAELAAFMQSQPAAFDAIISADTLVYFGALDEPLSAAHVALRPSGLLIFTVEELASKHLQDHKLEAHGRYTHSESYIRQALHATRFELLELTRETLRTEAAIDVRGFLIVARSVS